MIDLTNWIDIVLPLAEAVETEQYTPSLEELIAFEDEDINQTK